MDAPKAPAGWYPKDDGEQGQRYWDGQSWTGQEKGTRPPRKPVVDSLRAFRTRFQSIQPAGRIAIGLIAVLVVSLVVGISVTNGSKSTSTAPTQAASSRTLVEMPQLVGKSLLEAEHILGDLGIPADSIRVSGDSESGKVLRFTPRAGTTFDPSTTIVSLTFLAESTGANLFDTSGTGSAGTPAWVPAGFQLIGPGVAGQIADHRIDCSGCGGLTWDVVSEAGCPGGLYVEANFIDGNGVVVDWSNDSIPTLGAMEHALVEIYTYNETPNLSVKITKVNCH